MDAQYRELTALIRRVRNRWRAMTALRAWSLAGVSAALVLALALAADRMVRPDGLALVLLWSAATLGALTCLAWMAGLLRRAPDDARVARLIEEQCPDLEDALVTAIAQRDAASSPLAGAVLDDAVRRVRAIDVGRVITREALRQAAVRAGAVALVLAAILGLSAGPGGRAARVAAFYLFPDRLVLDVAPGDVKVRAGEALRIVARIEGAPTGVVPVLRLDAGAGWRETPMEAADTGFVVAFAKVTDGFRYTVTAAGASSGEYTVTVVRPPRVDRIDLRYEYPRAFGMPPREERDGGDIYGPSGTRVRVTVYPDQPATEGVLNVSGGQPIALRPRGTALEGELVIGEDSSYRVALADADGLRNPGDTEYFIRTLEDRPPDVRIIRPATDQKVSAIEEVPIEARADDDFGVASFELVYAVRGGREMVVPFEREGSGIAVTGRRIVYLEDLRVQPGDFITYYARARDISRGKRSSESRSDIFFLEVTPFEEEFVASQSQGAGAASDDRSLEDMVQAQKDVITATWKLDRRGRDAGARSQDDIRTVARAQGELRARAAEAAMQMQRTNDLRRRRQPGRGAAPPADLMAEAIGNAAQAMAAAQQALDALQTSAALPHEMTALNELLRAQAEIRRREVQRANNGSGRGMNRQQQDLSSLFDRELARQQQTAYETPKAESRESRPEASDALEKIRELARRQDELNHEQRELARREGARADEIRRELERLTREQTELRRQAEELARQLQQEARQAGQSGRSGQSGRGGQSGQSAAERDAARELQRISEEMQSAASELRRENPQEASARGSRAAGRLRDLEQRMRGAQPDNRRRALGELQLESRQLADAQRRLAQGSAAEQASQADAARRRAAEQERLADRAGRLEQGVRQLAETAENAQGRERDALAEAARALERQRVAQRMREAARAERQAAEGQAASKEGGQQPAPGRAEDRTAARREGEEIARALERLADTLASAGADSEESQRLTEELSRLRQLREELARLDRQLAEVRRSGEQGASPDGRDGQRSGPPQTGDTQQQWQEARELLEGLQQQSGLEQSPPAEGFNPGRSAPGTEAWKQDFATWDEFKVQLAVALERAEQSAAAKLRQQQAKDRLNAGATQSVPDQYRELVERYYRALASGR